MNKQCINAQLSRAKHRQQGVALLEALIAILIFSFGVLGLVGLQASSIGFLSDARDRVDASQLAAQLASTLQVTDPASLTSLTYGGSGTVPPELAAWVGLVEGKLPGAGSAGTRPIISVVSTPGVAGAGETVYTVAITVRWKPPSGEVRQHRLDFVIPN